MWRALRESGRPMTAREIAKAAGIKITDVYGALGWLGREGKIEVVEERKRRLFRLIE